MAQINKPTDYFNTVTWTGNSSSDSANQTITGVGFQPDFHWHKVRSHSDAHQLRNVIQGNTTRLASNSTGAENASSCSVAPNSDGFVITGDDGTELNSNGKTYVTWNWLAGGTASSNTDGSITTQVSANTTAGFSIVTYTGNGTAGATIGHGLNQAPEAFISKVRNQTNQWHCGFAPLGWTKQIHIDTTGAAADTDIFNDTDPTSSVVTLGSASGTNWSGNTFVAYCFHSVKGYSKIGKYTGNGSSDGTFVYTGFKPAMVILKVTSTTNNWNIFDNKRSPINDIDKRLFPNLNSAEQTGTASIDFLSNGFKCRNTNDNYNASGATYIYMAFAENPLVGTNNIPATAR